MNRRGFLIAATGLGGVIAAERATAMFGGYAPPPSVPLPDKFIHSTLASGSSKPVGVRLVNLFDASGSVDDKEFKIQIESTAAAIESDDFRNAIFFLGGPQSIALCFADFGTQAALRIPWVDIRKGEEHKLKALAEEVRNLPRRESGSTNQVDALYLAGKCLKECPWQAQRNVVDMLTDGEENNGPNPEERLKAVRHELALKHGATLNSLVTVDSSAEKYEQWAWKHIATEPGFYKSNGMALDPGFIKVVATQKTDDGSVAEYHKAMTLGFRRKLILEVAGMELEDLRKLASASHHAAAVLKL